MSLAVLQSIAQWNRWLLYYTDHLCVITMAIIASSAIQPTRPRLCSLMLAAVYLYALMSSFHKDGFTFTQTCTETVIGLIHALKQTTVGRTHTETWDPDGRPLRTYVTTYTSCNFCDTLTLWLSAFRAEMSRVRVPAVTILLGSNLGHCSLTLLPSLLSSKKLGVQREYSDWTDTDLTA